MDAQTMERIADIDCFLLDMDGTIYLSDVLIDGAIAFLQAVEAAGKSYLFLTNNSSRNAAYYQQKLSRLGIEVPLCKILTSGQAAGNYLCRVYPQKRVWVLGNEYLKEELTRMGVQVVEENPEVVLVGYDNTLTYEKLCDCCDYVRSGLPYIATHPDFNCPVHGGFVPDLGSFMMLIEGSTGRKADVVVGKPEWEIIEAACARTGVTPARMAMCGDRLYTDIAAGKRHGLLSILVLTGESKCEDIATAQYAPDFVLQRLGDLAPVLQNQGDCERGRA